MKSVLIENLCRLVSLSNYPSCHECRIFEDLNVLFDKNTWTCCYLFIPAVLNTEYYRSEWLIWQRHTWTCCYLFIPAAMNTEYCRSEWLIWLKHNWTCCYLFMIASCSLFDHMNGQCTLCKNDKLKGLYQFRRSNRSHSLRNQT